MATQSCVKLRSAPMNSGGLHVRHRAPLALICVATAVALGACAAIDTESFRAPQMSTLLVKRSVANYKAKVLPPVQPQDMVDAAGHCAGAVAPPAAEGQAGAPGASPSPEASTPLPGAISLDMTECDVVRHIGVPEKVEIGTGESGERSATLTYLGGQKPGIYTFRAGRLAAMERAPEPVAQKPGRKPKSAPPKRARPTQLSVQ